jgi:hypothetical protein
MFKAIVMVCSIYLPDGPCFNFIDDWGPYLTEERCKERVMEMTEAILPMPKALPPPHAYSYKCEVVAGEHL